MKKWSFAAGMMMILSAVMIGCGKEAAQPVDIAEGVDKCEICHMGVANDQHATEILMTDGKALKFDDIGCMYQWIAENGTEQIDVQYVRDYLSKEWVQGEQATYVYDENFKTPMGYGIYSFKEKSAADAFTKEQQAGTVMVAQDLKNHTWESSMKKHKAGHGEGHGGGQAENHGASHGEGHGDAGKTGEHTPSTANHN
ncbi:nitrous oxide reductase accessory protein NosL [Brevibacillus ruminantium]|uniref:Nitrous oxide reductase accessory protein NosL n=1 Tax=Brevibacillus ruminantium TaxID=2950604 RepID=A0ABY4WML7_9BACL|nr:nitrous oxide reductase accessory protein NosL [Brevibacillus ruminantium]USG65861.1 nitrous oxide reductase accessory protein NosL [Brevibacillus ruminantium]